MPVGDLSLFGAGVYAKKSDKLARGKVVQVTIDKETTTAIIRSEIPSEDSKQIRYGLEFIQPTEEFLDKIREVTESARRLLGEEVVDNQLWLRSS